MHWIDPTSLPSFEGRVSKFLFNSDGNSDGFLFSDGQQVHFPPHLSQRLRKKVKIGDTVRVHGLKPRGANVLVAFSLTTHTGHLIHDATPSLFTPAAMSKFKRKTVEVDGMVERQLYAPKGKVCGAILKGGTQVRMQPKGNELLAGYLSPGKTISVWGSEIRVGDTNVIDISHVGFKE